MKIKNIAIITLMFIGIGCYGQSEKPAEVGGILNQPKEDIKVKKEFDESGRLIKYDSTYSYSYSTMQNSDAIGDSIFDAIRNHFKQNLFFRNDPFFDDIYLTDSIPGMGMDFYSNDEFMHRFWGQNQKFNNLFFRMDSLQKQFFMDPFRDSLYNVP